MGASGSGMPSNFISHYTQRLSQFTQPGQLQSKAQILSSDPTPSVDTNTKLKLRSLLVSLEQNPSKLVIQDAVDFLSKMQQDVFGPYATAIDLEEETFERAIMAKLVVLLYSDALDTFLAQCVEVEKEKDWWERIERSDSNVAWYFLQTLPLRLQNVLRTIVSVLESRNLPVRLSQFTPASLRRLFPSPGALRPSILVTSLFPHLQHESHLFLAQPGSWLPSIPAAKTRGQSLTSKLLASFQNALAHVLRLIQFPHVLSRQECRLKRKELERLRDERARILGNLSLQRSALAVALENEREDAHKRMFYIHLRPFMASMQSIMNGQPAEIRPMSPRAQDAPSLLHSIQEISLSSLPSCNVNHAYSMKPFLRPSRLTLAWPKLFLIPPLAIYVAGRLYASRTDLRHLAEEAVATSRAFVVGWLLEPLKDVIDTVRAKGDAGVIVRKEGVLADLESLERMALSLAKDQLKYTPEQLAELSRQVRVGDLTPILKVYEDDIKTPVKSAITGRLLRSLFIQVQKAKVDIDQALTGIDKLLKSQELTFAFVGVAPALAVVYFVVEYFKKAWSGGQGRGRYGGRRRRANIMFTMRRVERLIVADPGANNSSSSVSPLTAGLLLLSVARLREYAQSHLPKNSKLREGFLEDVDDLEDPELGKTEKKMIVERMWRSWGKVLEWDKVAGERLFT